MQRLNLTSVPFMPKGAQIVGILFFAALVTGCGDSPPTVSIWLPPPAPTTPVVNLGYVTGFVWSESGECLLDARIELMDGPRAGAVSGQSSCDIWWIDGFFFDSLVMGETVTVRASAKGYRTADIVVTPTKYLDFSITFMLQKE